MAVTVRVTVGDTTAAASASGKYAPDVAHDLANRCLDTFKAAWDHTVEQRTEEPRVVE